MINKASLGYITKKASIIITLVAVIMALAAPLVYAGELELKDSYPLDGGKGVQVENSSVKLYFNHEMRSKKFVKENAKHFKLTDSKGRKLPIRVLYSPKEKGAVLVLVDKTTLESDSEYKLTIKKGVRAANGAALMESQVIKFRTVDTQSAIRVNMVMMGLMMVGVVFMSRKAAKMQEEKEKEEALLDEKVNPYKVAKETGKSVEDVIAETEKHKEKQRKKLAKKMAEMESPEIEEDDEEKNDNYAVKDRKRASVAGSRYVDRLREKRAEDAKKRAQYGTTKPKKKGKKK